MMNKKKHFERKIRRYHEKILSNKKKSYNLSIFSKNIIDIEL